MATLPAHVPPLGASLVELQELRALQTAGDPVGTDGGRSSMLVAPDAAILPARVVLMGVDRRPLRKSGLLISCNIQVETLVCDGG